MLRWLLKSVRSDDLNLRVSVAVALGLHVLLILISFLMHYLRPVHQITIQKNQVMPSDVTIIIDPRASVTGTLIQAKAGTAPNAPSVQNNKPAEKQQTTLIAEKKTVTKKAKAKPVKKVVPKTKKQAKPAAKKTTPKKEAVKPKKPVAPVVKETPKKEEKLVEAKPVPVIEATPQTSGAHAPDTNSGPIMIARSTSEAAAMTAHLAIQEELLRVWHPPIGIEESLSCQVRVIITDAGVVQLVEMVQSSGMLLFDVSARAAVQQAVWPRTVWGATLELCLQ